MEPRMGLKIKYNRVSTLGQKGERFKLDNDKYDLILFDKISGAISFKDRPKGREIVKLVEKDQVDEIITEEFSRLGRNTGDVIQTLDWLEDNEINVIVRNIGLQSRPDGKKNPIWKMISSIMSSLYEMELENIKERTAMGRQVYIQRGGKLGRPEGSNESEKKFLEKNKTKEILKLLNKGRTVREIAAITKCSSKTILKVRRIGERFGLIVN